MRCHALDTIEVSAERTRRGGMASLPLDRTALVYFFRFAFLLPVFLLHLVNEHNPNNMRSERVSHRVDLAGRSVNAAGD